jgi:phosphatidylglycerophosphatase A
VTEKFIIFFATGGYAGFSPVAPGTIGTLWGIPLSILLADSGYIKSGVVLLIFFSVASWLASRACKITKVKDPPFIVCDEVVGFLVASFLIPITFLNIFFIFLLYRIFDILKPFPVNLIDDKVRGGIGIVLDDVVAGIYANLVFSVVVWLIGYH